LNRSLLTLGLATAALAALAPRARAAEVALDLDSDSSAAAAAPAPSAHPHASGADRVRLMGRVDLSYEVSPAGNLSEVPRKDVLKDNHFLVFLKAKASPDVSFLGEIVSQTFYSIDYQATPRVALHFGKIPVPFGDNSRYHHFYGGVQGIGAKGILFPLIWAEFGADAEWDLGAVRLDTYVVNGISSPTAADDPVLNAASDPATQAVGLRARADLVPRLHGIASFYYDQWQPGRPLLLGGLDATADYRLIDAPVLRDLRFSAAVAYASVQHGKLGSYSKYADFVEVATQALGRVEPRVRYGTYIDNSRARGSADSQGLSAGVNVPVSALNLLAEYQWNFEGADERPNDLFRLMLSCDF
jgi:hypothetical protein